MTFDANADAKDAAAGVSSLVASRLAENPRLKIVTSADIAAAIGQQREAELAGKCTDSACMAEITSALGARYLVNGRLDRFGARYVMTATLFDSQSAASVAKPRADATAADELPAAAGQMADAI